jgi:hypothetical protein
MELLMSSQTPQKEEDKTTQQLHVQRDEHAQGVSPKFINRIVEDSKPDAKVEETPKSS